MYSLVTMRFIHAIDSVVATRIVEWYSIICLYLSLSIFFLTGICAVSSLEL